MIQTGARLYVLTVIVGLLACTPSPMQNAGAPDAPTTEHYDLAMNAIKAKSQPDAQAALSLLRSDILRAHTNSLSVEGALVILRRAGSAVDQGDWTTAQARVLDLKAAYGGPQSSIGF